MFRKFFRWVHSIFSKKNKARKKYSLEEYLDAVSVYTDSAILKEEQRGYRYTGGECMTQMISDITVRFTVKMYFVDSCNKRFLKSAYRDLLLENFLSDDQLVLKNSEKRFEILKPKDGE